MMNTTHRPKSFLFTTWEGGGNVPPALTLAAQLVRRGHRVRVMSDGANRGETEAAGAEFVPWTWHQTGRTVRGTAIRCATGKPQVRKRDLRALCGS